MQNLLPLKEKNLYDFFIYREKCPRKSKISENVPIKYNRVENIETWKF